MSEALQEVKRDVAWYTTGPRGTDGLTDRERQLLQGVKLACYELLLVNPGYIPAWRKRAA